jgi:hypothetical protein
VPLTPSGEGSLSLRHAHVMATMMAPQRTSLAVRSGVSLLVLVLLATSTSEMRFCLPYLLGRGRAGHRPPTTLPAVAVGLVYWSMSAALSGL